MQYLQHHQIDKWKWNACLERATHPLVYACSWYLDVVAPGWSALVVGDYEAIFPIPEKRKWGMSYALHPKFAQQLGWFKLPGVHIPDDWQQALPLHLKLVCVQMNVSDDLAETPNRKTHIIRLDKYADDIRKGYNTNTRRNVKKAGRNELEITQQVAVADLMGFKRKYADNLNGGDLALLERLLNEGVERQKGELWAVTNKQQEFVAITYMLCSYDTVIYLLAASSEEGMQQRAMFFLVDFLLHHYQNEFICFDFEGGNLASLARFFKGFGAHEVTFPVLQLNRFAWPLRLIAAHKAF